MRMMLACGGVPVLLGLFLGRSLHFKRRHLELSSPRRKGMMGGLTANGSPPISSPSRTIIHWHPNTEFREDQSSCEAFWQEHTSEWAKGYIVAELREE